MEIQIHVPSHVYPNCGEWWIVEPIAEHRWAVIRFGLDFTSSEEAEVLPMRPECWPVLLEPWPIAE